MIFGIKIATSEDASQRIKRLAANVNQNQVHEVAARAGANLIRDHLAGLEANHQQADGWWKKLSPGQWPSTHWYEGARNSVQAPQSIGGASFKVSITQVGFALQYFGGTIVPKEAKLLTIPANPDTYGRRAREISGLKIGRVNIDGRSVLALMTGDVGVYSPFDTGLRETYTVKRGKNKGQIKTKRTAASTGQKASFAWIERQTTKGPKVVKTLDHLGPSSVAFWLVRRVVISAHPGNLPTPQQFQEAINHHVRRFVERALARRQGEVVGWTKSAIGEGYGVRPDEDLA